MSRSVRSDHKTHPQQATPVRSVRSGELIFAGPAVLVPRQAARTVRVVTPSHQGGENL